MGIQTCCVLGNARSWVQKPSPGQKLNSSSSLARTCAISCLGRAGLRHLNNVRWCGEVLPVSCSCSYKLISPHPRSPYAHRELIFLSFHLQDMRFSLQYYNPSSRSTCTFFFFSYPCWDILKKRPDAKLLSMAYPPDWPAPFHNPSLSAKPTLY